MRPFIMFKKLSELAGEFRLLLKSVPTTIVIFFVMAVMAMNLLANKSITLPFTWMALDCGIIVSWVAFLTMDIVTRRFGPRAANMLSVFAVFINLIMCVFLFVGSLIPGTWSAAYIPESEAVINTALDLTFRGTWYVILGSSVAFIVSAFVNNSLNWLIGKAFGSNSGTFKAYAASCYISTAVAQYVDNLVFALIVSHVFFGWTLVQCLVCAAFGMIAELLCEIIFSGIGYRIYRKWEENEVGYEYFNYRNIKRNRESHC